jgi:hypothetical protein
VLSRGKIKLRKEEPQAEGRRGNKKIKFEGIKNDVR